MWDSEAIMTRSILLSLFIFFTCIMKFAVGHNDLRNVAYGKPAYQSSEYHTREFPASKAVNGLLTDYSHTDIEKTPWLRIDLGRNYTIHEIEVFARKYCCAGQLHDFDVRVGKSIYDMDLCGHFTGSTNVGQRIGIWCPSNTVGRYVQLQIVMGWTNVLSPAEVLVWGRL
ncbi:uncharacterized protein LOC134242755 [Saccostrea cucullata]|uniref:uncharacterized protein LOC134242755 n=1 Tax=Saccostrea cuccullata TaxID=36930 RepID=UPI002ED5458D